MVVRNALLARQLDAIDERLGRAQQVAIEELLGQSPPVSPATNLSLLVPAPVERPRRPRVDPQEAFPPVPKKGRRQPAQGVVQEVQPAGGRGWGESFKR